MCRNSLGGRKVCKSRQQSSISQCLSVSHMSDAALLHSFRQYPCFSLGCLFSHKWQLPWFSEIFKSSILNIIKITTKKLAILLTNPKCTWHLRKIFYYLKRPFSFSEEETSWSLPGYFCVVNDITYDGSWRNVFVGLSHTFLFLLSPSRLSWSCCLCLRRRWRWLNWWADLSWWPHGFGFRLPIEHFEVEPVSVTLCICVNFAK